MPGNEEKSNSLSSCHWTQLCGKYKIMETLFILKNNLPKIYE